MLDFALLRAKKISLDELAAGLTLADLQRLTDEMVDAMLAAIAEAQDADVTFVPVDLDAHDKYALDDKDIGLAWTLGHVIVHATASGEEGAARSVTLARGVPLEQRMRYEMPWERVTTVAQLRQRLEESRRIRHALLSAWPDPPHLDMTFTADYKGAKPRNAITIYVAALAHDDDHLGQIGKIMTQVGQALAPSVS